MTHRDLWAEEEAGILPPLMYGTSLERISDESVTWADSGFVRRNMWFLSSGGAQHAESHEQEPRRIRQRLLTIAALPGRAWNADEQDYEFVRII